MDGPIRFKEFSFKKELGELTRRDASGEENITRLQPQPSKLLELLLENYPEIVTHEQIKERVWPDVKVGYEGSIHFCIRQIRSALGDQASNPEFIETIPRRGYRWIAVILDDKKIDKTPEARDSHVSRESQGDRDKEEIGSGDESDDIEAEKSISWITKAAILGVSLLALVFVVIYSVPPNDKEKGGEELGGQSNIEKVRIGIMPFQPPEAEHPFANNTIAFRLLEKLTNQYQDVFEVIGPTTTEGYEDNTLNELIEAYQLNCILNGRFLSGEDEGRLLTEVIRATDGAHVWVKFVESGDDEEVLIEEVIDAVVDQFVNP